MTINIAAVTTGAFLGLLALVALVACVPPITRFLGDLFCCPWRIPFTKRKRLNDDEDVDKSDLPYSTGEPRPGTPVDNAGYQRTSQAMMSAISVVDPETAKEHMRRSADYRRSHSPNGSDWRRYDPYNAQYGRDNSPPAGEYHQASDAASSGHLQPYHHQHQQQQQQQQHLQVPPHGGSSSSNNGWRPAPSPERTTNYPPSTDLSSSSPLYRGGGADTYHNDAYNSPEYNASDAFAESYVDVQRPAPSHVYTPPEMSMHGQGQGYFPQKAYHSQQDGASQQQQWTNNHTMMDGIDGERGTDFRSPRGPRSELSRVWIRRAIMAGESVYAALGLYQPDNLMGLSTPAMMHYTG
ncbi:hypothetical protein M406DRAFT_352298 [Cryphonectria parasitica EP155]|uniref:Uncharacterized protein n=1 Tax=Cryphonectria parasitica (strain ATCC 38755 / EP155) TaxID=660469 RepID=A0A9P4XZC6_CRYP1|nr:uncharacterized protein M406DRAFT_352298 [Cryphonectria parasitica EP155]KAF3763320.1 hypothetical protein M406DRAFT_352298 [Cryphonectria parasitica EP155]